MNCLLIFQQLVRLYSTIAAVNANGVVTAKKAGTVTLYRKETLSLTATPEPAYCNTIKQGAFCR